MQSRIKGGLFQGVDFLAVLYYLLLVAAGCICITAASFDEETADFFAFSHFYIKQYMWVTAVLVVALVVLLLDVRYYHMWAYPLYIIGIVVMIGVLIAGKEVNGAKSWIELGSLRIQPVEFVKIATALALARVMSNYSFSINRFGDLLRVGVIIGIPMLLTILQNDTGNKHSPTTIVAAITSRKTKANLPTHVPFTADCVKSESIVLLEQIRTIDKSRLDEYIGKIDKKTMGAVDKALITSFGIKYMEVLL